MVSLPQAMFLIVVQISIVVLESMHYHTIIYIIECNLPYDLSLHLLARLK